MDLMYFYGIQMLMYHLKGAFALGKKIVKVSFPGLGVWELRCVGVAVCGSSGVAL